MSARLIGALLLAAACAPVQNDIAPGGAPAAVSADSHLTLERHPCFGTCPVYKLRVTADGTVTFDGERFTAHQGRATAQIPADSAAALMRFLERDGFFDLEPKYTMDSNACGPYHTDAPRVIVTLVLDGRTKTVEHDYGCGGAPGKLREMQGMVDRVAGTGKWVGH